MYGLGYTPKLGSGGNVIDCDAWSNLFEGICWQPGSTLPVRPRAVDPSNPDAPAGVDPILPNDRSGFPSDIPWLWIGLGVVGLVAVMIFPSSGPRRYGR